MEKKGFPYDCMGNFMDKIKKVMRFLTLFLLLFTLYSYTDAYSQKTKLKVNLKDATLLDIIYSIERQSEFVFMYGEDLLPALNGKRGDIKIKSQSIDAALEQHFKPSQIDYHINGRQVVLKKGEQPRNPESTKGVQMAISGTISDDMGPLPGASVVVKGTTIGTTSDFDGNYSLEVTDENAILVFSYIGYATTEVSGKWTNHDQRNFKRRCPSFAGSGSYRFGF